MTISNKFNFAISLFVVIAISAGCNLTDLGKKDNSESGAKDIESHSDGDDSLSMDDEISISPDDTDSKPEGSLKAGSKQTTVKFAKGKTSRGYEDAVVRGEKHTYIIGASKGQTMSVKVNSLEDNANFVVISPKGGSPIAGTESLGIKSFNEVLDESGKYKIIVAPTRGNATFKINFTVSAKAKADPPDNSGGGGGSTKVVKFGKGKTSANYSGAVIRAESDTYILGAKGGQLMSVSISALENNAVFNIVSPSGGNIVSERKSWSGQLPADGKYKIIVSGTRGNATYKINFAVR